jgi:hypothetical protein
MASMIAATRQKAPIAIKLRITCICLALTVDTSTIETSCQLEKLQYATLSKDCRFAVERAKLLRVSELFQWTIYKLAQFILYAVAFNYGIFSFFVGRLAGILHYSQ